MDVRSFTPALRLLGACLHLLMVVLLLLPALRALADSAPAAGAIVAASVCATAIYAVGPLSKRIRESAGASGIWLGVLGVAWLVLLVLTPDGVWAAFPLFFVQLHLLPVRWGVSAVLATTTVAVLGFALHQRGFGVGVAIGPVLGAAVAVATVLGYQALYRESEGRRRLIEELVSTRADLATAERAAGTLAERERLAREIHDTLAQGLSSIQLLLRAAERAITERPSAATAHIRQARQAAQDNLAEARRFVRALTPPSLEHDTLPAALQRLCDEVGANNPGLEVRFDTSGEPRELPTPYEVALLRVAQSALANTARHARAQRVGLTLSFMDTSVSLDVVDDGTGFDPDAVPGTEGEGGFGINAMRSRARSLGGGLSVESAPGQGTAVAITLPLPVGSAT